MLSLGKRMLIVAPHPDDEVLGVGGTMARYASQGVEVFVCIITRSEDEVYNTRNRGDAIEAHAILGVTETKFLDFPAAGLDRISHADLNEAILQVVREFKPHVMFIPFPGDLHRDHQEVFASCMVAVRPNRREYPISVLCYETLSETNWNAPFMSPLFNPNVYISIEGFLDRKIEAFRRFSLQTKEFPHERSLESIRALAYYRGSTVHVPAAEAFMLVRYVDAEGAF